MSAGKAVASPRTRVSALRFIMPGIVLFWLAMTFIGHWVAPYGGAAMQDADLFEGMSRKFLLGTDYLGRDMLSRILEGARFTVGISLAATALAVGVGLLLALTASAVGGIVDQALSRFLDALISIPSKMFGLVVVAAFGASIPVLIITMAVIYVPGCYRINRAAAVNIAALDFVSVARARGESTFYIMLREILRTWWGRPSPTSACASSMSCCCCRASAFSASACSRQTPTGARWCGRTCRAALRRAGCADAAFAIASLTIAVNLSIDAFYGGRRAREGVH